MSERKINLEEIANSSGVYHSLMDEQQRKSHIKINVRIWQTIIGISQ